MSLFPVTKFLPYKRVFHRKEPIVQHSATTLPINISQLQHLSDLKLIVTKLVHIVKDESRSISKGTPLFDL